MLANRVGDVGKQRLLLVDDIADRRMTLKYLREFFLGPEGVAEIKTCVLLNKFSAKLVEAPLDFVGFDIPDVYVAGCGMDGGKGLGCLRNRPYICYKKGTLTDGISHYTHPTSETMA